MDCDQAQDLLSPFFDGQLDGEAKSQVAAHIDSCEDCAQSLLSFGELAALSRQAPVPQAPNLWDEIDSQLNQRKTVDSPPDLPVKRRAFSVHKIASLAALLLLVGASVILLPHVFHDHDELAVDFDHYLDAYAKDPNKAAEVLFAKYPSEVVDVETATKRVGYRPVVANALPEGYTIDSMHVMKMPCCTCIKTVCRNDKGTPFVVFEHDSEQPLWFGDRQKRDCDCGGKPTSVVDFDKQIAATWQVGKRSVTVVGIKDTDEITKLMPFLGQDPNQS
ncbi:MAG: hypothetical protein Fues2KO_17140 [Fuerstiella sp.]